jgi:catechol 2,3-dioxygenase-like lactoylglutathione lyase family enzyme
MEVLSSRVLLHPCDFDRSEAFYRTTLDLPVYREYGSGEWRGVVFFLGIGFLELSGRSPDPPAPNLALWLDVAATHAELQAAGVPILRPPQREPWGLDEMWIADPDGVRIAVIEVPPDHPLRRRPSEEPTASHTT